MKKLYLDMTKNNTCSSIFMKDTEIIRTGTTVYSMPASARNAEYQRLADEYDVHFIFDDVKVRADIYTIPWTDIMATDSQGGYIVTVGEMSGPDSDAPICYIDREKNIFKIAENFREFIDNIKNWKENRKPFDGIRLFSSKEEA